MFDLGDRIVRYLAGKALIGVGLIAAIVSILLSADVAIIASLVVIVIGNIITLGAA
ncbi:hypothetical protein [Paenibacillus sp. FSL R7-269]|uniref:hypothetical protein n=1 Tax=Paenibacillus sp. FSL R7-269 TaxID=1226755 RepID=UPI0012ECB083|nr:hypothetical protein [Paenibacillus sp. FSL R7-269]